MERGEAEAELRALAATVGLDQESIETQETIRPGTLVSGATTLRDPPKRMLPRLDLGEAGTELELKELLGRGGMGEVWLARERTLERDVAVKTLRGEAMSASAAAALLAEGLATGALEHPSIVPVHALGAAKSGAPALVMKRIEGATLEALVAEPDHPSWPDLERRHGDRLEAFVEVLMGVADALHFAHLRGFVHRDVKPENVMVGPLGETYLLDWGIALQLDEREEGGPPAIVGTPAFMAPELVRGEVSRIDARTDVYLLGATLHAVLTGEPPHRGDTLQAVLLAALISEPPPPPTDAPPELLALALRCMAAEPEDRPASAREVRDELAAFLRHRSSLALAVEAQARLDSLAEGSDPTALASRGRALTEARFGFAHALREWDENAAARAGLRRTARLLVELELERGSPESAAAHLQELDEPDEALAARIEAAREELRERDALADQARQEKIETDPTYRGKARVWFSLAFVGMAAVAVSIFGEAPPVWAAILVDGMGLLVVLGAAFLFRESLMGNRWGRQVIQLFFVAAISAFATGLVTWLQGNTLAHDAAYRNVVFAAVFAGGAAAVHKALWVPATWGWAMALVAAAWPAYALSATLSTILVGIASLIWVSLGVRSRNRSRRG